MTHPFTPFDGKSSSDNGSQFLIQGGSSSNGVFYDPALFGEIVAIVHEDTPTFRSWTPLCRVMALAPMFYGLTEQLLHWHDLNAGDGPNLFRKSQYLLSLAQAAGKDEPVSGTTGMLIAMPANPSPVGRATELYEKSAAGNLIKRVTVKPDRDSWLALLFQHARRLHWGIAELTRYHQSYGLDRSAPWAMLRSPFSELQVYPHPSSSTLFSSS